MLQNIELNDLIEVRRRELECLVVQHDFNFQDEHVIKKSVELDDLLNLLNKKNDSANK
ncbi:MULTISPECIES: Spo0E family sporulation regulatory protein-aspartic acid phosphatase [Paenibacillus]|uniref:Spo0E family sporulation regulatory protein-aspartic acid phosphatase n=1 Tax=Paenibacillus vandeheii TaxID=3035917 RepID=A0ABT8JI89_9BACL|nr:MULTISPECIES: Spo0E family sporulation regulatory protein-aspartic acid phosphatase [Paenibacillus]MDN4603869.1 Spo0E family sporulation regulatory protein-aspartic acid phosphatase [Paenibacillus vandeheii]